MRIIAIVLGLLVLTACNKKPQQSDLEQFVAENQGRSEDTLMAFGAGTMDSFMGSSELPISVFFYNVDGASAATLFVKSEEGSKDEFCYYSKAEEVPVVFNGRMGRYALPKTYSGKWVVVAYTTGTTYNVSEPILLRADTHPTIDISSKIIATGDSLEPDFNWLGDFVKGNALYFSFISNSNNDFISGVYTTERTWKFYDLSNVVHNVTPTMNPSLNSQDSYIYTNMGVGSDNWVRTFGTLPF